MAKQVITTLVDDIDGSTADQSITFGLDGVAYEIDLSGKNAAKMRKALEPYVNAGTKIGGGIVRRAGVARGNTAANRDENRAIRAWAQDAGKDISDRGRIPREIVDEYKTRGAAPANGRKQKAAPKAHFQPA